MFDRDWASQEPCQRHRLAARSSLPADAGLRGPPAQCIAAPSGLFRTVILGTITKQLAALSLIALAAVSVATPAGAQAWPQRPVRIIVITPPGGFPDFAGRILADEMSGPLGQPVVVENRPGGGGNIAASAVATAPPDGHTLLLTGNNHAVNATLLPNPGFDYVKSFAPIGKMATSNMLLVSSPTLNASSVADVLRQAHEKPGALSIAVTQIGTPGHLGAELFLQLGDVDITPVPYSGVAKAALDLVSGRVDLMISAFPAVLPLVDSGKLKALAVTRLQRSSIVPDIPTVAESGLPGFDASGWVGMMAPAGTPATVVLQLNTLMRGVLAKKDVVEAFARQGLDVTPSSPEEFATQMLAEQQKWAKILSHAVLK
jgi:tripartite-type tricarboxylate transporter receptor subunit TctC